VPPARAARLAQAPVLLRRTGRRVGDAVRAGAHDLRHVVAEAVANIGQPRLPALILDRIMQRAAIASSSQPPYSSTVAATASRWEM
jgi:hypothetical protein